MVALLLLLLVVMMCCVDAGSVFDRSVVAVTNGDHDEGEVDVCRDAGEGESTPKERCNGGWEVSGGEASHATPPPRPLLLAVACPVVKLLLLMLLLLVVLLACETPNNCVVVELDGGAVVGDNGGGARRDVYADDADGSGTDSFCPVTIC